ncbi:hypothetical protein CI109_101151 [Kwoniella shandongensis]|uniref:Uncharacterized protein n=1 Tax=Kwoniella shandongensis TaxID=1734106 RepID=A0A5M6C5D0_9TREE|nr:uncharacterized protein CI109_001620 [Kwoniella shandongensis]KAA5530213.1 hypothetical protein CI109_001620 [Kwoniella shandongensis]
MLSSFTIASVLSVLAVSVQAVPCVQFDANWNLYAFGGSSDVKLGTSDSWSSPNPTTLSTSGRPPWTGQNTQCILSQTNNAMYVIGGDSDLSKIYIYNFASDSWSTQTTASAPSDLGNSRSASVLDHDTNTLFTLTTGSGLYQIDMSSVTNAASGSALNWEAVESPSFSVSGYTVTAAQAANHIFYLGVPGTAAGSANVFVVHYAYFQPTAQAFSGSAFPNSAGQAISIPNAGDNVPYQIVFVPNDFSNTYVLSHWTDLGDYTITTGAPFAVDRINSTQTLPAPSSQDNAAAYAASPSAIVQVDASGNIYYLNNPVGSDYTVSSSATWQKLSYTLATSGGSSNTTSSTNSSSSSTTSAAVGVGSLTPSASGTGSRSASRSASASGSGASAAAGTASAAASSAVGRVSVARGDVLGLAIGFVALAAGMLL